MDKPQKTSLIVPKEVSRRTSIPRRGLLRMAKHGSFPPPVQISSRKFAWIEGEVDEWIANLPRMGAA